jgi:hypothetical protein
MLKSRPPPPVGRGRPTWWSPVQLRRPVGAENLDVRRLRCVVIRFESGGLPASSKAGSVVRVRVAASRQDRSESGQEPSACVTRWSMT